MRQAFLLFCLAFLIFFLSGCKGGDNRVIIDTPTTERTFLETGDELCVNEQGQPLIRLFSTTWCPHCQWIDSVYSKVVEEYEGSIEAHNWLLDTDDDSLTQSKDPIPASEREVYATYNPQGSIPTFVFGCKYVRIGNGYETQDDKDAEEREFRSIIDELIAEAQA